MFFITLKLFGLALINKNKRLKNALLLKILSILSRLGEKYNKYDYFFYKQKIKKT